MKDIVDVTRLQSGNITLNLVDVNMAQIVQQAAQEAHMLGAQQPIEVDVPDDGAVWARGDADRLHQVLINLLQNAIIYERSGPRYELRLRHTQDKRTGQVLAQIEVQDWGPGIPTERQAVIFDRFLQVMQDSQRARKGLGLDIVRKLIEQHRGIVFVESRVGQGSTFILRLPLNV